MLGGGQAAIAARQLRRRAVVASTTALPPPLCRSRSGVGYGLQGSSTRGDRRWASSSSGSSSSGGSAAAATAREAAATTQPKADAKPTNTDDEPPKKRPTRQTFQQFVELARPEAPAFLTALLAVAVGTGTTVAFPFAIGKCMDAMTLGSKAKTTSAAATAADASTADAATAPASSSSSWSAFFGGGGSGKAPATPDAAIATATPLPTPDPASTALEPLSSMTGREFLLQSFGPDILPPWFLEIIPPDAEPLAVLSTGLVGVFVLGACATFVRNVAVNLAGERIAARLRKRVFAAVMHRRLAFFDATRTGELLNRLSNDVTQVSKTLSADTSYFLRNFAQGAGALGMMLYTSPQLCAIMLGVIPPVAAWGVFFGRKVRKLSKAMADELAAAGTIAEERVANIRAVRALGNDALEVARYGHQVDNVFRLAKYQSLLQGVYYGVAMGSGNLGMVTVLYYGGQYVNQGLITVGDLSTMLLYSVYAGFSISALLSYYGDLMKAAGSAERIFDLMEADRQALAARQKQQQQQQEDATITVTANGSSVPAVATPTAADVAGPISFQGVTFAYPTRPDAPVLKDLDLEVREGETLALVGPSGSGKSSIAALLARMYEPDVGQILMGPRRVPLATVPKPVLRKAVSYVTQDAVLFSGTVRENLFLGFADIDSRGEEDPYAIRDPALRLFPLREPRRPFEYAQGQAGWDTEERMRRVREACRIANCLDFIEAWDQGFDTVVGERGAQLSGGQRARLALARAILRDSRLLLLDEISAALDSVSEAALHSALERVLQDRTAILIAHRWSSIQIADRVAVLGSVEGGGSRVIEIGAPRHLLATSADSAFRRLVEHQLKGAAAGGEGSNVWRG